MRASSALTTSSYGGGVPSKSMTEATCMCAPSRSRCRYAASDGRLIPLCRVDPNADPLPEVRRCLEAGAVGVKLHPRSDEFTLPHPAVEEIAALANERRMPILFHAGRGIPNLGEAAADL